MIELDKKYVLHIPLTKYVDGKLMDIDLDDIFDDLVEKLNQNGFDAFYITKIESYYKSRKYDEKLITIFTDSDNRVEHIFKEWFLNNNDALSQEAFAYELNETMIIEDLD